MPGERKKIRDAVVAVIRPVIDAEVTASRNVDAREKDFFVNVFFESGDVQYDGVKSSTAAILVLAYQTKEIIDDDLLDESADLMHSALENNPIAEDLIQGFIPIGWEYIDDRERQFSGIYLRYSVTY